jgi:hypothetical protein
LALVSIKQGQRLSGKDSMTAVASHADRAVFVVEGLI